MNQLTLIIPDDWKADIIQAIATQSAQKNFTNIDDNPWLTEPEAQKVLQFNDLPTLRKIAKENNIRLSKPSKKIFYHKQDVLDYIENGIID